MQEILSTPPRLANRLIPPFVVDTQGRYALLLRRPFKHFPQKIGCGTLEADGIVEEVVIICGDVEDISTVVVEVGVASIFCCGKKKG